MKITFYDKLFIAIILAFSAAGFIFNFSLGAEMKPEYITVHVNNKLVMEFSTNAGTERRVSFPFGDHQEHTATIEISGGKVRMLPLDEELCPRGICSHTGWISSNYQSIVCVPNRIIIAFSDQKLEGVDGVTY